MTLKKNLSAKRTFFAALTSATLLLTAACGGGSGSSGSSGGEMEPDKSGELVFYEAAPNTDLDPHSLKNDSSFNQTSLHAIYDRLIGFDPDGKLVPQLATEWEYVDGDLTSVALTLREGVKFHDGTEFNADAVKANLERAKALGGEAGLETQRGAGLIESVTAVDPTHVEIKLNEPDGGFIVNLGTQLGMMISPASLAAGGAGIDLDPIGAGPYKVIDATPNDVTHLERYDDYWDGPGDRPAKFTVKYAPDDTTRLNALRSGQADIVLLTPRQVNEAKSSNLELEVNATSSVWNIYSNNAGALSDVRVRQALMYSIDRESMAKALSFETGDPTVQLLPKGAPGYVEGANEKYPYDVKKGKELIAEAGYPDGLELGFVLLNTPEYTQLYDVLQQAFAEIGVTLKTETVDVAQASIFRTGEHGDIMLARWGGRADPLKTFEIVVGPEGTYTPGGVADPSITELIEKVRPLQADDPKRDEALQELNEAVIDVAATYPIMSRSNIYAYEPGCVTGPGQYLASGAPDWRDATIAKGC